MIDAVLIIISVLCILCSMASGIALSIIQQRMIDKVNAALPPEQRYDFLGRWYPKHGGLLQEYRRLDPQGTLIRRRAIWISIGMFAMALLAATVIFRSIFVGLLLVLFGAITLWLQLRISRTKS